MDVQEASTSSGTTAGSPQASTSAVPVEGDERATDATANLTNGSTLETIEARDDASAAPAKTDDGPSIEEMAAKKRKLAIAQEESRKRSKRMFGVLLGTLGQAKKESSVTSDAAKKRQETEERLAAKLRKERQEMQDKERRTRESRQVKLDVVKKEEDIKLTEHIYKRRHANKLTLAGFLCTSFPLPPPPPASDNIPPPFAPRLPHAVRIPNPNAPKPIYYLPRRLLPFQEDKIEDQIAAVKQAIRREKEDWADAKGEKVDELEAARRKRDDVLEEEERVAREERQKRRREQEQEEEKQARRRDEDRARAGDNDDDDDRTPEPEQAPQTAAADVDVDSTMNGDEPSLSIKGGAQGQEQSAGPLAVSGASGASEEKVKAKAEEDLEY